MKTAIFILIIMICGVLLVAMAVLLGKTTVYSLSPLDFKMERPISAALFIVLVIVLICETKWGS